MTHPHEWMSQPGGLAAQLLELRKASGKAGKDLAAEAGWVPSKVSRLENGRQMPSDDDIHTWGRLTGASAEQTQTLLALVEAGRNVGQDWRRRMAHGQAAVQVNHNELSASASVIRNFESVWIPGLLQTPDYARSVMEQIIRLHRLVINDIDAALALRLDRQELLRDHSKRFEFLIYQAALGTVPCTTGQMLEQLDRLQTVTARPNVRFGIIPMHAPQEYTPQNGFYLYDDLAVVETIGEERDYDNGVAETYARFMDLAWNQAVTGPAARRLIVNAYSALET